MVHIPHWEMRARNGDRVSFPRWGKRNVVSHHFTELVLEITKIKMLKRRILFDLSKTSWHNKSHGHKGKESRTDT